MLCFGAKLWNHSFYSVLNVKPYQRQNQTEPDTNYLLAKKNQKLEVCWPKKSLHMFWLLMMNRLCLRSVISRSWLENLKYSSLRLAGFKPSTKRQKICLWMLFKIRGKENNFSMKLTSKVGKRLLYIIQASCPPPPCGITLPSKQDVFVGFATGGYLQKKYFTQLSNKFWNTQFLDLSPSLRRTGHLICRWSNTGADM